jgi:hypothetical protein
MLGPGSRTALRPRCARPGDAGDGNDRGDWANLILTCSG